MRKAGVRIVLDNFGTGYSSLYHLRNFKLDKIKIDRSFIDTLGSQESAGIVSALVGLGHGLGLTIVADGLEQSAQRASLLITGCEHGQGFFFSQAVPAEETIAFFANTNFRGAPKSVGHLAPASANPHWHVYEKPTHHAQIPLH